jgi:hypothetical protein
MADKPRVKAPKPSVKAPKQRSAADPEAAAGKRRLLIIGGAVLAVLIVAGAAIGGVMAFGGGGPKTLAGELQAAGCTLKNYPGVSRLHITNPNALLTSEAAARKLGRQEHQTLQPWNSWPPTSGPHYFTPAVYGFYSQPLQVARVLHNLEHGGIYMLYGSKTPSDTVSKLHEIYDPSPLGMVAAPLPELGNKIALGAWTSKDPGSSEVGTGHLALCTSVDVGAYKAFISMYRGRGPEGFPLSALQPGGT